MIAKTAIAAEAAGQTVRCPAANQPLAGSFHSGESNRVMQPSSHIPRRRPADGARGSPCGALFAASHGYATGLHRKPSSAQPRGIWASCGSPPCSTVLPMSRQITLALTRSASKKLRCWCCSQIWEPRNHPVVHASPSPPPCDVGRGRKGQAGTSPSNRPIVTQRESRQAICKRGMRILRCSQNDKANMDRDAA